MNESQYSKIAEDVRSYLSRRYDLFLIRLLEKASRIAGLVITLLVVLFLASIVVIFGGIALAYVLGHFGLPMWAAYLIVGGVYLLLLVLALIFRKQWFINPIVGVLSGIIFSRDAAADPQNAVAQPGKEGDHA